MGRAEFRGGVRGGRSPPDMPAVGACRAHEGSGIGRGPPSGPISGAELIRAPYQDGCSGDSVVFFWMIRGVILDEG